MPVTCYCATCGKAVSRPPSQVLEHVFCSRACYHAYPRSSSVRTCEHCGKTYTVYNSRVSRGERFCSVECYKAHTPTVVKQCPVCGKDFTVPVSVAHRYTVCSRACRIADTKYIPCEVCGKVFRASRTRINRFCSIACRQQYKGETSIETSTRRALDYLGIAYEQEQKVGRYSIDFAIASLAIALEVDGEYWHRNKSRDEAKNRFLAAHGWRVVRLAEAEILLRPTPEMLADWLVIELGCRP